jgi:membrane fusion protein, multidrug efflux system
MKLIKKLLIIIPIICGIVFFVFMKTNKQTPVRLDNQERVQTVRVIPAEKMDIIPRVISYGYVQAERSWQAIPEVSGKVVFMNENLKKGHFIKQDETLLRIDTSTYGLAENKGVADLQNIDAKLNELEQSKKNTERLLATEKKSLTIASQELKRKRELFGSGYISASDLEKEERNFLSNQTSVNNLKNALALIPSQKKALEAQKKSSESSMSQKRLDVSKTEIRAPFDCRLSAVNIELYQFAGAGSILIEAQSVDRAEIPVPITPKKFLTLMPKTDGASIIEIPDIETLRRAIGLTAKVRLPVDDNTMVGWDGWFSRTSESMDVKTGAMDVYIVVEKPYGNIIPGKRPPLVPNMYVEVELTGRKIKNQMVIPRSAIHEGNIYINGSENRLIIKSVDVSFFIMDVAVLSSGLEENESLILTDLVPAIEGMLLKPVTDSEAQNRLKQSALGETK